MLQLNNNTPFAAKIAIFPDQQGIDSLYIIVKATFNIGEKWILSAEQQEPVDEDEYWSENPQTSSLKNASEMHIGKPFTDIIMTGHAKTPQGKKLSQMDLSLSVGKVKKTIKIIGDRCWKNGSISVAEPFNIMPLIYEKAYGGVSLKEGVIMSAETRNPVGCGFTGNCKPKEMNGLPLPNLEDPRQLIQHHGEVVTPTACSFISPSWQPRLSYAGTYDHTWQAKRAPYLPLDFDIKFFNMADKELIYPGFLQGGEPVQICGVNHDGNINFNLPIVLLSALVSFKNQVKKPKFNLETLLIEPDSMRLSMSWRASLACDKKILNINEVTVNLARSQE